ncbi:unnamed protein product [Pocillopora meandrina]|uniref:RING finger and CHY zinc finger domain-containing protein 1 n=1 Tax=Pocillopora meandrina TaxID=46732 RepID=A0AAU9VXF6_9CNID|nr:unnamed protein product [Pocillopora meandrina]
MASNVEEEGKQYASAGREESSEEHGEPTALYNVSTAIQKDALEAMDMLQLEIQRVKEENEIFKEFFSKIMECGGDEYRQMIERGGLNELQHTIQETINRSSKAERGYGQSTTVNSNHTHELRDEVECHKDQCREQREERQVTGHMAYGVTNAFLERHSEDTNLSNCSYYTNAEMLTKNSSLQGASLVGRSTSGSCIGGNNGSSTGLNLFRERQSGETEDSVTNRNYGTESEEACAMVERVPREREEREEFGREIERKEREIRAERARKKREREARELRGPPQQQEPVTGQSLWLCEHFQRHCRVRFPCCNNFYSCHRCHNNSKECENEEAKGSHATHLKCSYCHHEQEIGEDSGRCRSCGAKMSSYFCAICKHFSSIDKNPYHCEKCGICRVHKDKSFHCDVCNFCLYKPLQGKHKCRPNAGHDDCCICFENTFEGCQILPCFHLIHDNCLEALMQNGSDTCPLCRHPLHSPAPD